MKLAYFHRHQSRPLNVIVGGVIAVVGMVCVYASAASYHFASMVHMRPTIYDWQTFDHDGLTNNRHIQLTNVTLAKQPVWISQRGPLSNWAATNGQHSGSTSTIADHIQQRLKQVSTNPDRRQDAIGVDMLDQTKVLPQGVQAHRVPPRVVVPRKYLEAARDEIAATGTLTGLFTRLKFDDQTLQSQWQTADGSSLDPSAIADLRCDLDLRPRLRYSVLHEMPGSVIELAALLASIAVAVFGLVACGSGGVNRTASVLCAPLSIGGLAGYPLRYGRGTSTTRAVYVVVGAMLLAAASSEIFVTGRVGFLDGNVLHVCVGFSMATLGLAAMSGAALNYFITQLENRTYDPSREGKGVKMSFDQACGFIPKDEQRPLAYQDPSIVWLGEYELNDDTNVWLRCLIDFDFHPQNRYAVTDQPLGVASGAVDQTKDLEEGRISEVTASLGCDRHVYGEVQIDADGSTLRFVSVLEDGLPIQTFARRPNDPSVSKTRSRFGTGGFYQVSSSDQVATVLTEHLEQSVAMAKKRSTTVVGFEEAEFAAILVWCRRSMAAIAMQYGDENIEVDSGRFGRFYHPPRPIEQAKPESKTAEPESETSEIDPDSPSALEPAVRTISG